MSDNPASPPLPQGAPPAESVAGVPTVAASAIGNAAPEATATKRRSPLAGLPWWALALRGAFAILFGLVAVVFPIAALGSLVLLLSAYLAADGALAIVSAFRAARAVERWAWLGVEGVLNIAAALIALFLPGVTVLALVILLAAWAVASGVAMLAAAFRGREGRLWLGLGGAVSVVWGVLLTSQPIAGAVVLTFWLGLYALAFGFVMLVLGLRVRNRGAGAASAPATP
jgi:uncharacterized membrane protein HdeD (DUF308 family)